MADNELNSSQASEAAVESVLASLLAEIPQHLGGSAWTAVPLAGGIESSVARLRSGDGREALLKYSARRSTANDNDPELDFLDLYVQEHALATWCAQHAIPVARPYKVFLSAQGIPAILMTFVDHDGSIASETDLGRLMARLHDLDWPGQGTVAMRGKDAASAMCDLTTQRMKVVSAASGREISWIGRDRLLEVLAPVSVGGRLLHMDFRSANVLCRRGKPLALIDWANAIVADPIVELARTFEYDQLGDQFRVGYGHPERLALLSTPLGLASRLYTAVMMCVLFLCEIPDPGEGKARLDRLEVLLRQLNRAAGSGSSEP